MALAQLMPGPLAAQLAIYLGYVHYRILGATLVGLAFVLPSFLMVVAIGAVYARYGGIGWMQAVFYGVGAAVIGIIAMSAYKLTTKNIGKDKLLWAIFLRQRGGDGDHASPRSSGSSSAPACWSGCVRAPPKFGGGAMHSFAAPLVAWLRARHRRLAQARPDRRLLRLRRQLRLRQRPGDRAVPLRRRRQGVRLAHRPPVRRRGRGGDDHARPGGHHDRLHRLPRRRLLGRGGRRARHLRAVLPVHDPAGAVLQEARQAARRSWPSSTA